ncbi:hypothetical protein DYBT9623_04478 [Dyadobacter sp. CECT 9623]|uniref:AAA+ ATPase domain-containing protein n=1 Tax=Dyadobacter linearis TaxID=2823330 RepID=A0ABM8UVU7_9BACT|nr:AAA family ATPase [Dyadobacter sp. CECT 9623]CAG5072942.1 hypothetical protein DYBT9623_04478 [Dyadobacter sp. CECT 9623]
MPKFYVCSAGKRSESYAKENFDRIIANSAYILDEKAEQKGPYDEILPGSILLLKYNGLLVAYGKAIKLVKQENESWNLWVLVDRWFFKNQDDNEQGVPYDGIKQSAITRSNYSAIKEVSIDFGWQKLQQIDNTSTLFNEVKNSSFLERNDMQDIIKLLEYKKQIILQGPPGTGKTYTAKEIANALVSIGEHGEKLFPDVQEIKKLSREGDKLPVTNGVHESVVIAKLDADTFRLQGTGRETFGVSYAKVADSILTMNPNPVGKDVYPSALAKYIIQKWVAHGNIYEEGKESASERIKLIQFHPAYSYEDFVRGITAKTNGVTVEYRTENKILADFASKALVNYLDSKKEPSVMSNEIWIKNQFEQFIRHIEPEFEKDRGYLLNDAVSIFDLDDDGALRYSGHNWIVKTMHRMKVSDVVNIYLSGVKTNLEVKKLANVNGSAKQHATYYLILANHFRKFIAGKSAPAASKNGISEKKFVLVIDEINRANLPAVLGELIYALEYRDESVETMYDIDGERSLRLPPNLYIIGTMNTADRSVGHIDYAIRRRFAFMDVLPSPVPVHVAAKKLFKQVSELFVSNYDLIDWKDPKPIRSEYVAADFRPEDIWIGHSYFMSEKQDEEEAKADLEIRLKYEILPLLKEYIKDGLLVPDAEVKIKELHV